MTAIDPFEEVAPAEAIDPQQELTARLARSMMWDMIGPDRIRETPGRFGQQPASLDVLNAEAAEMWERKYALMPFGMAFPMMCYIATQSATEAVVNSDEFLGKLSEEDIMKFRMNNLKLGTAIVESVVGHMLQRGLIKYGDRNEFLG